MKPLCISQQHEFGLLLFIEVFRYLILYHITVHHISLSLFLSRFKFVSIMTSKRLFTRDTFYTAPTLKPRTSIPPGQVSRLPVVFLTFPCELSTLRNHNYNSSRPFWKTRWVFSSREGRGVLRRSVSCI